MSSSVDLKAVQLLDDLYTALGRFGAEAQESLNAAALEASRTLAWLNERQRHWRTEIQRLQELTGQAQAALRACESRSREDRDPCRVEREQVRIIEAQLRTAEEELRKATYWLKQVQEALGTYQKQANQFASVLTRDLPKGRSSLKQKADTAHRYFALQTLQNIVSMLGSGKIVGNLADSQHLTDETPSHKSNTDNMQDIEIDQLPWRADHVQGPEDFQKVSYERMVDGVEKLQQVVQPGVLKGAIGDDFLRLDAQLGLEYEMGYQRVYDAFYGNDAIRIEKIGNNYEIINGYHRLFVASQLGIKTLPMRLIEC